MAVNIFVDGKKLNLKVPPTIEQNHIMIGVRDIAESLGASVIWLPANQEVKVIKNGIKIQFNIGQEIAAVNGERKVLPIAPKIEHGITMVPLRFLAENLEAYVEWDSEKQTVFIYSKKNGEVFIKVFLTRENQIKIMKLEDYVKGAVAAEMPPSFHIEALKAQAMAVRTFAVKRMKLFGGRGCRLNPEADICDDSKHCQGWKSKSMLRQAWGDDFGKNWHKISLAVDATKGLIITYNDIPIEAVYHSTCGGFTEDSENVWGNKVSYLRKVECNYCNHSPFWKTQKKLTVNELFRKLNLQNQNTNFVEGLAVPGLIEKIQRTNSGRIQRAVIKGKVFGGKELKKLLNLPSTRFGWRINELTLNIMGYGHGVGMCQYGADGMAREGKKFNEILSFYYTGIEIKEMLKPTPQKPLKGKKIVIDPGHGGKGSAQGPTGLSEDSVNLKIAVFLEGKLKNEDCSVLKTRSEDVYVPLAERTRIANDIVADLFISIHQNGHENPEAFGTETFYYPGDREGRKLAAAIQQEVVRELNTKDRGIKEANFFVLRETNMPSVLIEVVFITNPEEEEKLKNEEFLNRAAEGILKGIKRYYTG